MPETDKPWKKRIGFFFIIIIIKVLVLVLSVYFKMSSKKLKILNKLTLTEKII